MIKIKKFKIKISPYEVFKIRKKEGKNLKWDKDLRKEVEKDIESKIGFLSPKVVYGTFKREDVKEIVSEKIPAVSFVCVTIGENASEVQEEDNAIFDVAIYSAEQFAQKLIKEEAEKEEYGLSEKFLPEKEKFGKILEFLGASKISVKIDENGNIYPPWSKILMYKWEK